MQVFDRPASQAFYSVAGRLLFIGCSDPQLSNLIVELFRGWQLTSISDPGRSPDVKISFRCGESPRIIPRNLDCFEIAEGGKCFTDGAEFFLTFGDALIHLVNGDHVAVDVSFAELPGVRDPLLARASSFAVCAALRRYGLFDLHSAGVVDPESGKAVLVVGHSGSGKSTLASQLALSGWSYLCDDEVLLSLDDDTVEARGFRSFFALRNANGAFKHCFEPETVYGSRRVSHSVAGLLLFVSVSGESETRLKPLTQAESMTRLLRACPWATYDVSIAGANLEVLSTLARQARGFDLSAGFDLLEPGRAAATVRTALRGRPS
jgi:hypothetical protein